jgi:hypothetical protein
VFISLNINCLVSIMRSLIVVYEVGSKFLDIETPSPESVSELYRPSYRRLWAKLLPTFGDIRCLVIRLTDPYGRNLGFLDRSRYFFFQVSPQLYSRG